MAHEEYCSQAVDGAMGFMCLLLSPPRQESVRQRAGSQNSEALLLLPVGDKDN